MANDVISQTNDFSTEFLQLVRLCGFEFSNYAGSAIHEFNLWRTLDFVFEIAKYTFIL